MKKRITVLLAGAALLGGALSAQAQWIGLGFSFGGSGLNSIGFSYAGGNWGVGLGFNSGWCSSPYYGYTGYPYYGYTGFPYYGYVGYPYYGYCGSYVWPAYSSCYSVYHPWPSCSPWYTAGWNCGPAYNSYWGYHGYGYPYHGWNSGW
jgi:hypothetical protein